MFGFPRKKSTAQPMFVFLIAQQAQDLPSSPINFLAVIVPSADL
jgi:hypothetical protein